MQQLVPDSGSLGWLGGYYRLKSPNAQLGLPSEASTRRLIPEFRRTGAHAHKHAVGQFLTSVAASKNHNTALRISCSAREAEEDHDNRESHRTPNPNSPRGGNFWDAALTPKGEVL